MSELAHHGILGQRWGRRRFQNDDGTYTEEGKKRYFGTGKRYRKRIDDIKNDKVGPIEESKRTYKLKKDLHKSSMELEELRQKAAALKEKMNDTQVKLVESMYRDEYVSGRNFAAKALIKLTGDDIGYAEYTNKLLNQYRANPTPPNTYN